MNDVPMIACRDLQHAYERGGERLRVLDGVDLVVERGDFVALMGPSGSGKTTLLNLLGGLDRAQSGVVEVHGLDIGSLSTGGLTSWRAGTVGFIFQFYNLLPVLDALGNVELPLLLTGMSQSERRRRAQTALRVVGLEDRSRHKPDELSGGQQQRVAIARAIVNDPEILICDEPTGDLDRENADSILELLQTLNRDLGKTIVMVTHDPQAASYAGRVMRMDKGQLEVAA